MRWQAAPVDRHGEAVADLTGDPDLKPFEGAVHIPDGSAAVASSPRTPRFEGGPEFHPMSRWANSITDEGTGIRSAGRTSRTEGIAAVAQLPEDVPEIGLAEVGQGSTGHGGRCPSG